MKMVREDTNHDEEERLLFIKRKNQFHQNNCLETKMVCEDTNHGEEMELMAKDTNHVEEVNKKWFAVTQTIQNQAIILFNNVFQADTNHG